MDSNSTAKSSKNLAPRDGGRLKQDAAALGEELRPSKDEPAACLDVQERTPTKALIAFQKEAFEMAASGASLMEVLEFLTRSAENQTQQKAIAVIHLLNDAGTRFVQTVAPSLPAHYSQSTNGMDVSSGAGPCCAAITGRRRVIMADVAASVEFPAFRTFALPLGIRGGWSTPILSSHGKALGTFANYFREVREPSPLDNLLGDIVTRTASIIIERKRAEHASQRLAAVVEFSDDAIVSKDLNGVITSWNRGAERIFGYTAEEMVGKPITLLIPAERLSEEATILNRIRRAELIDHYETVRRRKDGRVIEVSLTVSPIKDADGKIIGASKIARDITERRRLELQQRSLYELVAAVNSAASLSEIFEGALNCICECQNVERASILLRDADGVMRFKAWRGISEGYRQAVEGHSPWKPDDPDPQPVLIEDVAAVPLEQDLRAVIVQERIRALAFIPLTCEKRLLGKIMAYHNGPHAFTPAEIRPMQTVASQIAFAIERRQIAESLERQVNERTASLRQAIAQMEEFSYTVSHDLRAPLRGMQVYTEALLQDYGPSLPNEARHYLDRIAANSARLDKMILDVLTFSRVARAELRLERVNVDRLARQIVEQYPGMRPPDAQIDIQPLHDLLGHEPSLTQALSNLFNNAVKFVAPAIKPSVRVWSERKGGRVRLWVADNGIGIDPKYQHRLFGMFERVHPDLKYDGTGVGLAIVKKAVERMGGRVGMESDGVRGSRFWIELGAVDLK